MKLNSYFKKNSKRQIPKYISIFFPVFVFGFGLDFGFTKIFKKQYQTVLRYLAIVTSVLVHLFIVISIFYDNYSTRLFSLGTFILQYVIYVWLLYTTKYNLYNYYIIVDIYYIKFITKFMIRNTDVFHVP